MLPDKLSAHADDAKTKAYSRSWWERHPMTYDWDGTGTFREGSPEFFAELEWRFRFAAWFAQAPGQPIFSRLIDYAGLRGKRVLEIGCGAGTTAAELSRQGARVTAIDLTSRATGLAQRQLQLLDLRGDIFRADAERLPFADEAFDFVWSWGVIHHTPNTQGVVAEIHRVLRPGGKMGVMVYHTTSIRHLIYVLLLRGVLQGRLLRHSPKELGNLYSDGHIAQHFTRGEFLAMFHAFRSSRVSVFGQRSELLPKVHRLIRSERHWTDPIASRVLSHFGWFLFVEAEK